ncbi:MAG: MetQ/NlpA family ABC transporter substrate-binding protein, partial [Lachnospiraceae bacterium]|nr:MetQ/NlpA family ABC transporter substrate-binding protein [Lachnospiraceae bacterium]
MCCKFDLHLGCGSTATSDSGKDSDNKVIKIAASPTPHAEILEKAKPILAEKGIHLVSVGEIHYEPFGIYPGTKKSLDELSEGDSIALPNDTTNEARALLLLLDNGII